MATSQEIAQKARLLAQEAIDRMLAFLAESGATAQEVYEARYVALDGLVEASTRSEGDRSWSDSSTAIDLLLAANRMDGLDKSDDAEPKLGDPEIGYRLLREGDRAGALALADAMLRDVEATEPDHWSYGNLVHHGHILRGRVFLQDGDIAAATVELLAAASTPGSPQLNSFGADLSLAWSLLGAGQDQAVLAYLRGISAIWTPER